jgi:GNAT superfamily N-acetyltransferase
MTLSTQYPRDFTLNDGRSVRIRPMRTTDRATYEAAVYSLSPRSRYLRFFAPIEKMSERLLDLMTQVDGRRHVAWLALTPDESTGVAVVRYVCAGDDGQSAEVAIAVADDWQRGGLGGELLRQTVDHARLAGLDLLTATTLRENSAGAGLLHGAGFAAKPGSAGYRELEIRLRARRSGLAHLCPQLLPEQSAHAGHAGSGG